jgi:predicted nucleotidyltransferase
MYKYKTRDKLISLIIEEFSGLLEINQIYFFGSIAEEKDDNYSDIDIIVCTDDLAKVQNSYEKIITKISPIINSLWLESSKQVYAESIMLKDYSPYHKIDFTLTSDASIKTDNKTILVYEKRQLLKIKPTSLRIIKEEKITNQFNNYMFSVPRFTKCLFRKDVDMYKRWKGLTNAINNLLYEKVYGWDLSSEQSKSLTDMRLLKKNLNKDDFYKLLQLYPINAQLNLARSFVIGVDLFIELYKQKANYFDISLNEEFIQYIKDFLNNEVNKYIAT